MPNSIANRMDVRYVAEVTWGTTPATPAMKLLRQTGESLNGNIQTAVSEEIRDDRNEQALIQVGQNAGGGVDFELSYTSFDDMLEAALCSTWVVDGVDADKYTLVNGVLERSFTLLKRFQDVTQYFLMTGARVNTLDLGIQPNKIVTGSLNFLGKDYSRSGAGPAGATYPAGSTTLPMNGASGVSLVQVDGGAITGGLMNFNMQVNNNRRAQDVIGSLSAQEIVAGKFEVTGDFEVYFADGTLYDKFIGQTAFAFQTKMTTPSTTGEIWIDIPNAKYESGEVVARGTDTDVMFKAKYRALYHAGTLGSLKLTKNGPL